MDPATCEASDFLNADNFCTNWDICERIGYHAYSADLLRAVLDSGCRVVVYRVDNNAIVKHTIK